MLGRAYHDLDHDVLLRAHVILRIFVRSGSDTFLPSVLSLDFILGGSSHTSHLP